jgi:hypothetical protein
VGIRPLVLRKFLKVKIQISVAKNAEPVEENLHDKNQYLLVCFAAVVERFLSKLLVLLKTN